jgi:acetyltransferase-like isoleucine patch superfamily enzyme
MHMPFRRGGYQVMHQESEPAFAPGETTDASTLSRLGLLRIGEGCSISPHAVFVPADAQGVTRLVEIRSGCQIGPFSMLYGGTVLHPGARVEDHVIVGKPEQGYAVGHNYPGAGAVTVIGAGAVLRAGVIAYAGAEIGAESVLGHHTLLRSFVTVGEETQLGHNLTIERVTQIGSHVRCSPGSHITSSCVLADRVFLGAGVRTVNDRQMIWRDSQKMPELVPPSFGYAARIGSGSVILGGANVGEHALVGAGSVVTRDVPAGTVAYGVPARVRSKTGASAP